MNAADLLEEGARTFRERNAVYGDNYKRVGPVMEALFPNGINLVTADDHLRFHIFMLIVVKLSRYVCNWEVGGHRDSIHDAMVYSAMLEDIDLELNVQEQVDRASEEGTTTGETQDRAWAIFNDAEAKDGARTPMIHRAGP